MFDVNFLAVAVAAVTFMVGGLWYAPPVFGRAWAREAGVLAPGEEPRLRRAAEDEDPGHAVS